MKSLYFTRFLPTWDLGGGSRRLMQVWAILQDLGCELRTSARGEGLGADRLRRLEKGGNWLQRRRLRSWAAGRRPAVFRLREISRAWSRDDEIGAGIDLAFLDDPIYFLPLFETLERRGVPIVAVCHNLESLVPSQVEKPYAGELLRQELDVLSRCRLVVTISREESWLLNNTGIANCFFPYYPLPPVLDRLLAVRRLRSQRPGSGGVLLLANAKNPQSGQGARQAIAAWRRLRLAPRFGPLLVAGFHSERIFAPELFDQQVRLLGTLENSRLDELLAQVSACLCHQENGGGALTRITEMLVAGVPVVASAHAARSHHGTPGLIEFNELDELEQALHSLRGSAGTPPPPAPDPAPLLAAIQRILGADPS